MSETQRARKAILERVRGNLRGKAQLPEPGSVVTPPSTRLTAGDTEALIKSFAVELAALTGIFHRCTPEAVPGLILGLARETGAGSMLAWPPEHLPLGGVLEALNDGGVQVLRPNVPLEGPERTAHLAEIERAGLGLTGVEAALADTGSIVVRSGAGRARLASLLAPIHVALVTPGQFYPSLYDWMETLKAEGRLEAMLTSESNVTVITGPSRTADIEKMLILGMHGPRVLHVICVEEQLMGG